MGEQAIKQGRMAASADSRIAEKPRILKREGDIFYFSGCQLYVATFWNLKCYGVAAALRHVDFPARLRMPPESFFINRKFSRSIWYDYP
jgi:hypothetical protein